MAVVVDERLLALDPEAREKVPQLAGVGDRAAHVVGEVDEVAVDRLFRLVDELLESAHHRVAADLLAPLSDLAVQREIALVHLAVGRVAERADGHAAEGVQVEPGEDGRERSGTLDHGARLWLARAERAGAELLRLGLPRMREVPV